MKSFPWLRKVPKSRLESPFEPPIWLGNHSNGEYFHEATPRQRAIRRLILQQAEEGARRHGMDRRHFLATSMGMATSLAAINTFAACSAEQDKITTDPVAGGAGMGQAAGVGGGTAGRGATGDGGERAAAGGSGGAGGAGSAAGTGASAGASGAAGSTPASQAGSAGGFFDVPDPMDPDCAASSMLDPESTFVLDLQTHYLERVGNDSYRDFFFPAFEQATCRPGASLETCFGRDEFIDLMFLQSETTVAMLSAVPAVESENPLTNDEIATGRDLINMLASRTPVSPRHAC